MKIVLRPGVAIFPPYKANEVPLLVALMGNETESKALGQTIWRSLILWNGLRKTVQRAASRLSVTIAPCIVFSPEGN